MRKYHLITACAIAVLICLQASYVLNLYSNYKNRIYNNLTETIYTSINKELLNRGLLMGGIDYGKDISIVSIDKIPQEELDSILKYLPLPPTPPRYNVEELRAKDIIRHSSELSTQRTQDKYYAKGFGVDLKVLDSVFLDLFGIKLAHNFVNIDKQGHIIDKLNTTDTSEYRYKTKQFKIGTRAKQNIVLYYGISPCEFIENSIGSLITSVIMLLIVVLSLIVQLCILSRKQIALNRIYSNINGTIHDLKSPLSGVVMTLDLAKQTTESEQMKTLFALNQSSVRQLIGTVDTLLTVARRVNVLHKEEISTATLMDSIDIIVFDLDNLYRTKTHTIEVVNNLSQSLVFSADLLYIQSIIRNLIDNALKYADSGVHVTLRLDNNDKNITFAVVDNGWGVARGYQRKLYKEFFQVPRGDKNQRGYGVGLNQVYRVVKLHNGTIKLDSAVGVGSTFKVTIPIVKQ